MKGKKIAAFLLTGILAASMLAGCGKKTEPDQSSQAETASSQQTEATTANDNSGQTEKTTEPVTEPEAKGITFPLAEPIEISVFVCTGDTAFKFEDTAIFKYMEEKTNVKFKVTNVNLTDVNEKRNVLVNSGDYPDVFIKGGMSPDELYQYGSEGILVPLEDLINEYAPNYKALIDERDAWKEVTSTDGHIYSTYEVGKPSVGNTPHMWINEQWLKNLGLSMPTTKDEFYQVLKAFKEQDADGDGDPNNEIPWITSSDISPVEFILPCFGYNMQGWWDPWAVSQDAESIEFFPSTDRYKEDLAFIAKCYEEGLLYKDSFSITCDQIRAMGQTGESLGVFGEWHPGNVVGYYDNQKSAEENKILEYTALVPFEGAKWPTSGGLTRGGFCMTDKCKYPEVMMAWIDYLYSEEGAIIVNYGIEGDTYDIVDGKIKMRDKTNPSASWGENVDHARLQMGGGTFSPAKTYSDDYKIYVDLEKDPTANLLDDTYNYFESNNLLHHAWPALSMTEEQIEQNSDISADTDTYRLTYRAEVITGKKDLDSTWDEYINTLNKMGLQTMVDNMNDAYSKIK